MNVKTGQKVICIENKNYKRKLNLNETYIIIDTIESFNKENEINISVKGQCRTVPKKYFKDANTGRLLVQSKTIKSLQKSLGRMLLP